MLFSSWEIERANFYYDEAYMVLAPLIDIGQLQNSYLIEVIKKKAACDWMDCYDATNETKEIFCAVNLVLSGDVPEDNEFCGYVLTQRGCIYHYLDRYTSYFLLTEQWMIQLLQDDDFAFSSIKRNQLIGRFYSEIKTNIKIERLSDEDEKTFNDIKDTVSLKISMK